MRKKNSVLKISDLGFNAHPNNYFGGKRAVAEFSNGYRASVISGGHAHCDDGHPYEIGVMDSKGLTYETSVTDDVLGYLSEAEANKILKQIADLPETSK